MSFLWSAQQEAIFAHFADPHSGNLMVRARAGTSKTTSIIEGVNRASEPRILLCAFNKRIAEELTTRIANPNAQAKTLHAIGFACVRKFKPKVKLVETRADWLASQVCGPTAPDTIVAMVKRLHTLGRETAPHAAKVGDLTALQEQFELEPSSEWAGTTWGGAYIETKALEAMELAANTTDMGIDYSDMIFLPVRNRWLVPAYDLVVVDEAQDMTIAQLEIAQGVCAGRIVVVGDDRQAIYGFRGADSGSLDRLKRELQATELGLTATYRCGQKIVAAARRLVPDFECGAAHDGAISYIAEEAVFAQIEPGDFLLSRTNAPLVSTAMTLLRSGKRTRIAGRDIGAGLKTLVRKMQARSVPDFLARVAAWEEKEIHRLTKAKRVARIDAVRDQAEMLISLAGGAKNVEDITARIDALFTDDGLGQAGVITCSSVHRAKGLEANRVFVLASTLRGGSDEEDNIEYVAITRAKHALVWVGMRPAKKTRENEECFA